eukprot:1160529-Pelagomonas_calceolata.AAC.11
MGRNISEAESVLEWNHIKEFARTQKLAGDEKKPEAALSVRQQVAAAGSEETAVCKRLAVGIAAVVDSPKLWCRITRQSIKKRLSE